MVKLSHRKLICNSMSSSTLVINRIVVINVERRNIIFFVYIIFFKTIVIYRFAEKSHLVRHYSFHSEKRPYKCEVCQKMYKTERCLKVHSLVHAAERPFICSYCNKGFLSSTKLKVLQFYYYNEKNIKLHFL